MQLPLSGGTWGRLWPSSGRIWPKSPQFGRLRAKFGPGQILPRVDQIHAIGLPAPPHGCGAMIFPESWLTSAAETKLVSLSTGPEVRADAPRRRTSKVFACRAEPSEPNFRATSAGMRPNSTKSEATSTELCGIRPSIEQICDASAKVGPRLAKSPRNGIDFGQQAAGVSAYITRCSAAALQGDDGIRTEMHSTESSGMWAGPVLAGQAMRVKKIANGL